MNDKLRLFIFIFWFSLFSAELNAEEELFFPEPEATVSMDFQDANLKDVLKIFSIQSGINFIASESVQDRKITLYLNKVPIKEAMDKLFTANNLSYEADEISNIVIIKDWGKSELQTVTKVFYLKYATVASSSLEKEMAATMAPATEKGASAATGTTTTVTDFGITNAIKKILSASGSIIEDQRMNSLIVTDMPSRMSVIEKTIAAMDVPVPQVILEVEMLDVSKDTADLMGFDFGNNPFTLILAGQGSGFGNTLTIGEMGIGRGGASVDRFREGAVSLGNTYAGLLDFLRTRTDTKFLARPKLLTLNNQTAEIKITTDESVGVKTTTEASSGTTSTEPERSETGVSLRVTPQIDTDTGEITMFIYPKVGEAVQGNTLTSNGQTFRFRDPEIRSTKSIVRIKNGETVILGGMIRNEFTQVTTKVPILGDIPILGILFRHKDKSKDKERELLVFITPRIIEEKGRGLARAKRIAFPEREQGTSSNYDRSAAINASLNAYER